MLTELDPAPEALSALKNPAPLSLEKQIPGAASDPSEEINCPAIVILVVPVGISNTSASASFLIVTYFVLPWPVNINH